MRKNWIYIILLLLLVSISCHPIKDLEPGDEEWSFVVLADVRKGYGIYNRMGTTIGQLSPTPDMAFCLGDIVHNEGSEEEWLSFWRHSTPITAKMEIHFARGNHEGNDEASNIVYREQTKRDLNPFYYAFQHRNCYFILLDTWIRGEENRIGEQQFVWLEKQLDSVAKIPAIEDVFLMMHHPLFPQGKHRRKPMVNGEELHQLILQYDKIKAVFFGHDHLFNRFQRDGMNYITTGGGGSPLHHRFGGDYHHFLKVSFHEDGKRINIQAIGLFNEVVENFDL